MRLNYYFLLLLCSLFILSCGNDDFADGALFGVTVIDFTAEITGPNGTVFSQSNTPVEIVEGESVDFVNTTVDNVVEGNGTIVETSENELSISWEFEGGNPASSSEDNVTVQYLVEGKYDVKMTLNDAENSFKLFDGYVCVLPKEPEPEACILASLESSDGRLTTHFFNDENVLIRADKSLNGILQEYSRYEYDSSDRLEQEQFLNPQDDVLGRRTFTYDDEDQITVERVENPDFSLVAEWTFTRTLDGFVDTAVLVTPDGIGGTVSTDISYSYDTENSNVIGEVNMQDGNLIGRIEYQYDTKINGFSGLNIQSFPYRDMTNNPTSIITYDANNNIVAQRTSTYQYSFDGCDDYPSFEDRTVDGFITRHVFSY